MTLLTMSERTVRTCPGRGPKDAKICLVGDFPETIDIRGLKPFSSWYADILDKCLYSAGCLRSDVYLTNVIKEYPPGRKVDPFYKKGKFFERAYPYLDNLELELDALQNINIFVALGDIASSALCGTDVVSKYRGYIMDGLAIVQNRKVLPTYHPRDSRFNHMARHYISLDLEKAKEHSTTKEYQRPVRDLFLDMSFDQIINYLEEIKRECTHISYDIEVLQYEISCLSISHDPGMAVVIPFIDKWTIEEEAAIWQSLASILSDEKITKVQQNGVSFDKLFLKVHMGIDVRGPQEDTMLAHSIMYPDMLKGLGFLGSLYCGAQAYWKDMVKFKNIKEES